MNENELWLKFRRHCPGAERIENSIKVGTPDVLAPTQNGLRWVELKILHGRYIYAQKSQLAFTASCLRLPDACQPDFLCYDPLTNNVMVVLGRILLRLPREASTGNLVKVDVHDAAPLTR